MTEKINIRFVVPSFRDDAFQSQIRSMAKRCEKLGLDPLAISSQRSAKLMRPSASSNAQEVDDDRKANVLQPVLLDEHGLVFGSRGSETPSLVYEGTEYELTGSLPVLAGWRFMGVKSLEHSEPTFRMSPFAQSDNNALPPEFTTCGSGCDHCETNRARKELVLLQNVDTGEWLQVGNSCVNDFLGDDLMLRRLTALESIYSFINASESWLEDDPSADSACTRMALMDYLPAVAFMADKYGYISRSQADDIDKIATVEEADYLLFARNSVPGIRKLRDAYHDAMPQLREKVRAALDYMAERAEQDPNNQYLGNVAVIIKDGWCDLKKEAGLAASIIGSYLQHLTAMRERMATKNEYLDGVEEGGRVKRMRLYTVKTMNVFHAYGQSTLHIFRDDEGRRYKWFGSGCIDRPDGFDASFTVKGHEVYEGLKQTVITRVVDLDAKADQVLDKVLSAIRKTEAYYSADNGNISMLAEAAIPGDRKRCLGHHDGLTYFVDSDLSKIEYRYDKYGDVGISEVTPDVKKELQAWAKAKGTTLSKWKKEQANPRQADGADEFDPLAPGANTHLTPAVG
ncbi:hypothetical protein [Marinobacterium sp. BA1]|uniref:hypothetical protein n=1 Tax=Marinobacterium sp. BA1 TaxID=3138931 RepID=UPI0032E72F5E